MLFDDMSLTFNSNTSPPCSPVFVPTISLSTSFLLLVLLLSQPLVLLCFFPFFFFQSYLVTNLLAHTVLYSLKWSHLWSSCFIVDYCCILIVSPHMNSDYYCRPYSNHSGRLKTESTALNASLAEENVTSTLWQLNPCQHCKHLYWKRKDHISK